MDWRIYISNKFLDDADAACPRTILAKPLLQVIVRTRNNACQEPPCYFIYKWKLLLLLLCPSLLLQFHCLLPACTHPVYQPQQTLTVLWASVQFLSFGAFACSCFSFKNFTTPLPTHTTIPLWKNLLLFKAQLKCPEIFCDSFPVMIIIVSPIHREYILRTLVDTWNHR